MNRIYQGRVSTLQIPDAAGNLRSVPLGDPENCPLWRHHCIFQDAVNYYLLALGALATVDTGTSNPVELNLRIRLAEAWKEFPRSNSKDKRSLRESVRCWLGLGADASMAEAMAMILGENDACGEVRSLAFRAFLSTILADKESPSVDGRVRNASKNLELFVLKKHAKNYPFESKVAEQAAAKKLKSVWIHSLEPHELAARLEFHYYAKINPSNGLRTPKASKDRLVTAVTGIVDDERQKLRLLDLINQLAAEFEIPNESPGTVKGEGFRRKFNAFLILKYVVADEFTLSLLRQCEERPSDKVLQSKKEATPANKSGGFLWEGQDPILAARSTVGYVFRAFTSFPSWDGEGAGTWRWKGFEIAAFAEALKSLNQFNQKTDEREKTRLKLESQRAWMLGKSDRSLSNSEDDEKEEQLPVLGGDPRFDLVKELEKDLTERLLLDPSDPFKISRAALRGFRDVAEKWNQEKNRKPEKLREIVTKVSGGPEEPARDRLDPANACAL